MTVRGNQPKFYLVPIQHIPDTEIRSKRIQHRLERLENGRRNLKADQKWPTHKTMKMSVYQQLREVPEIVVQPPTPVQRSTWDHASLPRSCGPYRPAPETLQHLLAPSTSPRADFPFQVTTGTREIKELSFLESSFMYFQFLPVEIRLEIYELELRRPKFIEAQFSSQFCSPTFVGNCTRGTPLLYVCKEARDVALRHEYTFITPTQRDFGKRYGYVPSPGSQVHVINKARWSQTPAIRLPEVVEKPIPFFAESDTIFFRSLDRPQGGLQSLACSISGFENIQHLALPLKASGLPLRNEWKMSLGMFRNLKTLTFLVGGKDQTWFGDSETELRETGEWYADGRDRMVKCDTWLLDVDEIGKFLSGQCFEERMKGSWDDEWQGINVRVVAWKKGV